MSNTRIALICTSLDNVAGGIEKQILLAADKFLSCGIKTYLFSYDNEPCKSFYSLPAGLEWVKCGNGLIPHRGAPVVLRLKQILNLRAQLIKFEITHLITYHHGLLPRSILASCLLPIINIASERNSLDFYKHISLPKLNLGFLSLFFVDKITVQIFGYRYDYPRLLRSRIFVVPNYIPDVLSFYSAPSFSSNIISMVGRLEYQKGFHHLLDIAAKSDCSCVKIHIAGEGSYRDRFQLQYSKMIESGNLKLFGNVSKIPKFLSTSCVFCFPSLWEGYPNALLEALRQGLPIVTSTRMHRLTDFVEHNVNGFVVADDLLFDSCQQIIRDQALCKSFSLNSFKKYKVLCSQKPLATWLALLDIS